MHLDPIIPALCALLAVVLALGIVLRRLRQPHVVAYIVAGVLLGPSAIGVVHDSDIMSRLGSIGVVLLLFFVGMEIDLHGLLARWRVSVIGTVLQVAASVGAVWLLGHALDWPIARIVLLGFVISLSSTAVVLKLLQEVGEAETHVGRCVTGILLVQDLIIIPMLIALGFFGADQPSLVTLGLQVFGGAGLVLFVAWTHKRGGLPLIDSHLSGHHEEDVRVLSALLLCFGMAAATGLLGLSTALGAFAAGILIGSSRNTGWIHAQLAPFRVVFVGAFFVSVGMLIDLRFLFEEWRATLALLAAVFIMNTVINAVVLRALGDAWRDCFYAAALLAQIGELSFVLAAVGYNAGMIGEYGYQLTIVTIALSLTLSPMWIMVIKALTGHVMPLASRQSLPDATAPHERKTR